MRTWVRCSNDFHVLGFLKKHWNHLEGYGNVVVTLGRCLHIPLFFIRSKCMAFITVYCSFTRRQLWQIPHHTLCLPHKPTLNKQKVTQSGTMPIFFLSRENNYSRLSGDLWEAKTTLQLLVIKICLPRPWLIRMGHEHTRQQLLGVDGPGSSRGQKGHFCNGYGMKWMGSNYYVLLLDGLLCLNWGTGRLKALLSSHCFMPLYILQCSRAIVKY